uniref:DYNc domain-containing protein n=1 Tax=Steinernema glaseri TaxID=37863 RepID=A0A1I7ZHA8_9BILA
MVSEPKSLRGKVAALLEALLKALRRFHSGRGKDPVVSRFLVVGAESSGKWSLLRQMLSLCERFPAKFRRCDSFWTEKPLGRPSSLELRRSVLHSALRIVRDLAQHQIRYSSAETTVAASELLEACDGGADSSELEALRRRLLCLVRDATFQEAKESGEHKCSFDGSVHFLTEEGITRVFDEQRTLKWSDVAESNLKLKDDDVFFFRIRDKRFEITVLDDVDVDALPSAIDSWIEAASVPKTRVHVLYAASLYDVALPLRSGPATTHFDLTLAHFSVGHRTLPLETFFAEMSQERPPRAVPRAHLLHQQTSPRGEAPSQRLPRDPRSLLPEGVRGGSLWWEDGRLLGGLCGALLREDLSRAALPEERLPQIHLDLRRTAS